MPSFSFKTVSVDNVGSEARDFNGKHSVLSFESPIETIQIAIERTYLSHIRLGLLLSLLSAAILLNARLPDPTKAASNQGLPTYTVPLGTLFFIASILGLAAGLFNYERLWKGLKNGAAFVQSSRCAILSASVASILTGHHRTHTVVMGFIALLTLSTIVTLLSGVQ